MIFQSTSSLTNLFHILMGSYLLYLAFVTNPNGMLISAQQLKIVGGLLVVFHLILFLRKEFTQYVIIQE